MINPYESPKASATRRFDYNAVLYNCGAVVAIVLGVPSVTALSFVVATACAWSPSVFELHVEDVQIACIRGAVASAIPGIVMAVVFTWHHRVGYRWPLLLTMASVWSTIATLVYYVWYSVTYFG